MSDIETVIYAVLAFIFGSIIGSFLNVVILRTPLKQSIITEPSHCFSCRHTALAAETALSGTICSRFSAGFFSAEGAATARAKFLRAI